MECCYFEWQDYSEIDVLGDELLQCHQECLSLSKVALKSFLEFRAFHRTVDKAVRGSCCWASALGGYFHAGNINHIREARLRHTVQAREQFAGILEFFEDVVFIMVRRFGRLSQTMVKPFQ